MTQCKDCGGRLARRRRRVLEKLRFTSVYECEKCGWKVGFRHPYTMIFQSHSHCLRCGTDQVSRLKRRDGIDRMSRNLYSLLARISGANLMHCAFCRLQYYDWRKPRPKTELASKAS